MHISQKDRELFNDAPSTPPGWTPKLWTYPVCEIFLAHPTEEKYLEFEFSLSGHWIGLGFQGGPRQWARDVVEGYVLDLDTLSMTFSYELLAPYLEENDGAMTLKVQCALSLQGRHFLAPLFGPAGGEELGGENALPRQGEKADFHQPERFWKVRLEKHI